MKTIEEITEIVMNRGGYKLMVSKYPTWISREKDEGCQIEAGKLKTFWIKEMSRVFDEPCSENWQKTVDAIEKEPQKQEEAPQQIEQTEQQLQTPVPETKVGIIPDTLTIPLLEKWQKMSTFERILMFQNTPKDRIEERKGRGGKNFKYVKGNFMDQEANIAFLFGMNSEIEGWHLDIAGVACYGNISFILDGQLIYSSGVGIDVQEYSQGNKTKPVFTIAEMMKNAHTDMKKKAMAAKGFNGDVYRGEV